MLPKEHNNSSVCCHHGRDQAAIQRVAQFADERSGAIRLRLEKNELQDLLVFDRDRRIRGLDRDRLLGEPLTIGFNSQYLIEFLKATDSDKVRIEFKDSQSAGQLRPESPDAEYKYRYVVMPMRI